MFIRAPVVDVVDEGVEVLASWEGRPVAVRDGPVVGTSFRPEQTDERVHDLTFFDTGATLPGR